MAGSGIHQSQTLSLSQTLAPQLQQSLQILQVPALELRQLIQQEVEINPVLEMDLTEPTIEDKQREMDEFKEEFSQLAKLDDEWREYMAQSASYSGGERNSDEEKRRQFFLDSFTTETTLQQHLSDQLRLAGLDSATRRLAELVIGNLDERGYLQAPAEEMARNTGQPLDLIRHAVSVIQAFDPPGIAATDLRECLLLQLRRQGRENSLEYRILDVHLLDLAKKRFPVIARKLGVTVEQIQKASESIAKLDPKPGDAFAAAPNHYVLPDVNVERVGETFAITLNNEQIPHLRISNTYKDLMAQEGGAANEAKEYIREKIRSGKFLIKSIHQRQQTISNIANEIVKRQTEFLRHGSAHLKPMNMSQVAEVVGVHETTVSRAISGKYIATPQGVFEMRYFFTPGYQTESGQSLSNTSVKDAIAALVRDEDTEKPLSDKEIVEILSARGIPIARRTVAKYRSELNILPSSMRKTY